MFSFQCAVLPCPIFWWHLSSERFPGGRFVLTEKAWSRDIYHRVLWACLLQQWFSVHWGAALTVRCSGTAEEAGKLLAWKFYQKGKGQGWARFLGGHKMQAVVLSIGGLLAGARPMAMRWSTTQAKLRIPFDADRPCYLGLDPSWLPFLYMPNVHSSVYDIPLVIKIKWEDVGLPLTAARDP
jgi:hypothetical protein